MPEIALSQIREVLSICFIYLSFCRTTFLNLLKSSKSFLVKKKMASWPIYYLEVVIIIGFKFFVVVLLPFFLNRDDSRYFIIAFEEEFVSNLIQT